ncbi:unnamed protein product, partial [Vitis vinifera]|uniref:Uncharacterized protein n=1 Tax=Vitis vinifera TaxID=29760 RepID=D7TXP2_VITVI
MQESNQEVPAWLSCYATRSSYGGGRSNGEYGTSGSSYGGEEYDRKIDYMEEKLQETIPPGHVLSPIIPSSLILKINFLNFTL